MRRITWLSMLCVYLLGMSMTMGFAQGQQVIREVDVRGFQNLTQIQQDAVKALVTPLRGQPADPEAIALVQQQIEETGYFILVRPEKLEPVADGVRLVFTVLENPVIREIRITGNTVYPTERLRALIKTPVGQVLNQNLAAEDTRAISDLYYADGYTLTFVRPEYEADPETKEYALVFNIWEPRINEIRISGNARTRPYVIRRQLEFRVGDVYNARAARQSLLNLNSLGIFQNVDIQLDAGTAVGTVLLNVIVVERRTGSAALGVQQSTNGWTGFLSLSDTNLFGTGQRLSLYGSAGADTSYQLSYTNPWIDRHRTSATLNLYNQRILREAFASDTDEPFRYTEKRTGFDVLIGRPVNENTRAFLGFRSNDIRTTDVENPNTPSFLLQPANVRSVSLSAVRDTRDPLATQGRYFNVTTEVAGLLLGGENFAKFSAEGRGYFIVKRDAKAEERPQEPRHIIYATRLMAGTSKGVPPFLDQYRLGGADSLRGYKDDRFPGENMLMWNHELRFPVTRDLGVVSFFDLGDAWGGPAAEELGDPSFNLRYSYGLGLRLQTPLGPFRLDYGLNGEGGSQLTFGIGSTF